MTDHAAPTTRFVPVSDLAALDDWFPRSGIVVLFLHAPRCWISRLAYRHVARLGGEVALVDVARDHDVKRAIAERTGVRHASPQAIVLHGGHVIWSASDFAITAAAVRRACRAVGDERSPQG
jgi:bacillithiol system protein YtxJ